MTGGEAEQGRDRVLSELCGELARHPAVASVEDQSPDEYANSG
jgi:hypothetical protein